MNFAEAIQGVQKPLSWSVWSQMLETSAAHMGYRTGVLASPELPRSLGGEPFAGIFYGRVAGNVKVIYELGSRIPGASGEAAVETVLGERSADRARKPLRIYARYPVVAVKLPGALVRISRQLPRTRRALASWWRERVLTDPPKDLAGAQALLLDAVARFTQVGIDHLIVSAVAARQMDQLTLLCQRALGDGAFAAELVTGYGGVEEVALMDDIWRAAHGRRTLDELVRRHGYHGPDEGNLATRSWREEPGPLEALIEQYARAQPESPTVLEGRRAQRRQAAERRLLAALGAGRRPLARVAIALAAQFIPLREVGKAAFLHTIDGARCAARAAGLRLADAGILQSPDDVFLLTYKELVALPRGDIRALTAERKLRHAAYERLELPKVFVGDPVPIEGAIEGAREVRADGGGVRMALAGIGVSGGVVRGRARVVHDPARAALQPGEILVCSTTDPSWTPLFPLAGALVIEIGGVMSHGAIVARELGVPCVINVGDAAATIHDGDVLEVDGGAGTVSVVARSSA